MAANFKIRIQSKNQTLNVFLSGDFDGSSAEELKLVLKQKFENHKRICLFTDKLKDSNEFGLHILNNFLSRRHKIMPRIEIKGHLKRLLNWDSKDAFVDGNAGLCNY